jgi:FlaA1/EpsC-like NDP-sugar epimerase
MLTTDARRRLALKTLQAWDLGIFAAVLVFTFHVANLTVTALLLAKTWTALLWLLTSFAIWHMSLASANLYRSRRLSGEYEFWDAMKGVSLATAFIAALGLLLRLDFITLRVVALMWLFSITLTVGTRVLLRQFLIFVRRGGRNLRFVLIVGTGLKARRFAQRLEHRADLGYRIIGCIDNQTNPTDDNHAGNMRSSSCGKFLGNLDVFSRVVAENVIDEVFIMLPIRSSYDSTATRLKAGTHSQRGWWIWLFLRACLSYWRPCSG